MEKWPTTIVKVNSSWNYQYASLTEQIEKLFWVSLFPNFARIKVIL